jgi:hypothetical protein
VRQDGSRRRARVVLLVLAGIMSVGKDALAEPARKGYTRHRSAAAALRVDGATAEPEPPQRWYGWQLLVADGSVTGLVLVAAAMTDGDLPVGLGLLFYASPIVHAVHGNPGRAAASLGLRALLPFAGGLVGMEASNCGLLGGECKGLSTGVCGRLRDSRAHRRRPARLGSGRRARGRCEPPAPCCPGRTEWGVARCSGRAVSSVGTA